MHYTVVRLRGVRMAVVLVENLQLNDESLIVRLQMQFSLPVMLAARDEASWKGVRARAQFDAMPYLAELLALDDVEWIELGTLTEPEIPF